MAMSASAGDFVKCVELVIALKHGYSDSTGDYQAAIEDIQGMQATYSQIQQFITDNPSAPHASALRSHSKRIRHAISAFQVKAGQYEQALGASSTKRSWEKAPWKLKWAIWDSHEMKSLRAAFWPPQMILNCTILSQQLSEMTELSSAVGPNGSLITSIDRLFERHRETYVEALQPTLERYQNVVSRSVEGLLPSFKIHIQAEFQQMESKWTGLLEALDQTSTKSAMKLELELHGLRMCMRKMQDILTGLVEQVSSVSGQTRLLIKAAAEQPGPAMLPSPIPGAMINDPKANESSRNEFCQEILDSAPEFLSTLDCHETGTGKDLVDEVQRLWQLSWPSSTPPADSVYTVYHVKWELPYYIRHFFSQDTSLGDVATITGGSINAFAGSCSEYIESHWPATGILLLRAVESLTRSLSKGDAREGRREIRAELVHDKSLSCGTVQERCTQCPTLPKEAATYETVCRITMYGSKHDQQEWTCALLWLCAALRNSDINGISLSGASIRRNGHLSMQIDPLPLERGTGWSCWYQLFNKVVVAAGFPIPARVEGKGLEISFDCMARWAKCLELTECQNGLVGLGLVSVLIPVGELQEDGDAIQWHLHDRRVACKPSEEHSTKGPVQVRSLLEVIAQHSKEWYKTLEPDQLKSRRAFLAWCANARVLAGTDALNYNLLVNSDAVSLTSNPKSFKTHTLLPLPREDEGLESPTTRRVIAPSSKTTMVSAASGILDSRISASFGTSVILYDTADRRAWLVDGITGLLHLVRISLQSTYGDFSCYDGLRKVDFPVVSDRPADRLARTQVLSECLSLSVGDGQSSLSVSDLIQSMVLRMELVAERLQQSPRHTIGLQAAPSDNLVGSEVSCITNLSHTMAFKSQQIHEGHGWVELARSINAITLFGKGFGDLIQPLRMDSMCESYRTLPKGKDYLAATVDTIAGIMERFGSRDRAPRRFHWALRDQWQCKYRCEHVQGLSLVPEEPSQHDIGTMLRANPGGALIFGTMKQSSSNVAESKIKLARYELFKKDKDDEGAQGENQPTSSSDTQPSTPSLSASSCPSPSSLSPSLLDEHERVSLSYLDECPGKLQQELKSSRNVALAQHGGEEDVLQLGYISSLNNEQLSADGTSDLVRLEHDWTGYG